MTSLELFVTSAPGIEPLLEQELRDLGLPVENRVPGGITLSGDQTTMMRANLESGLAQQVLLRISRFKCRRLPELAKKATQVPWEAWIDPTRPAQFRITTRKSRIYHTGAIEERLRSTLPTETPAHELPQTVHVRVFRDEFTVSIDTSGPPLHRRGYRLQSGKAPLREDLARALIVTSQWDANQRLVDPMMGAGTIVIEAALMARRVAPGHLRSFAFQHMPNHDATRWNAVRAAATTRQLDVALDIHGSDRDAGAWRAAIANAERAGVAETLHLGCAALSEAPGLLGALPAQGSLIANPPYGQRIGKDLRSLYQRLGSIAKQLPRSWTTTLVGSSATLVRHSGLQLHSKLMTDHGGTKVRFWHSQKSRRK